MGRFWMPRSYRLPEMYPAGFLILSLKRITPLGRRGRENSSGPCGRNGAERFDRNAIILELT
jgi:hypothetical protein